MSIVLTFRFIEDSVQTRNIFIIMMGVISIIVGIIYIAINKLLKKEIMNSLALNGLLLWLLSEFIFLCIGGELSAFGIAYELGFYDKLAKDILEFRESRNLAFSISFATSALLATLIERMWIKEDNAPNL